MLSFLVAYVLPLIVSMIAFFIFSRDKIKNDLRYAECITIGTVLFVLFGVAVSVSPGLNIPSAMVCLWILFERFEYEVKNILSEPICFWRKEKIPTWDDVPHIDNPKANK